LIQDLLHAGLTPSCVNDLGHTPADTVVASYLGSEGDGGSAQLSQAINVCSDLLSGGSFIRFKKIQLLYSLNYILSSPVMNRSISLEIPAPRQVEFAFASSGCSVISMGYKVSTLGNMTEFLTLEHQPETDTHQS